MYDALLTLASQLWPPNLLSLLLGLLARPFERHFYHSDLCAAYHSFTTVSVYSSAWLSVVIMMTPLRQRLQEIHDTPALFKLLGTCNQILLHAYLRGYFLLPNLLGPIYVCWVANANNSHLDDLAHLYGFAIGVVHIPLLLSVSIQLVIPVVFSGLRAFVVGVSRAVWALSEHIPADPAAAAQRFFGALHGWLEGLPDKIMNLVDGKVLRAESNFLHAVAIGCILVCMCILYTLIVDLYRPFLQSFAIHVVAQCLMFVGDLLFDLGLWVEALVVKRGFWEGRGIWESMDVFRDGTLVTW